MKGKILAALLVLVAAPNFFGQTTALTASVVDSQSVAWANGPYTVTFIGSGAGTPYTKQGQAFTQQFQGTLNGSGQLSITVTDVNNIIPANSNWKICVTPAVSSPTTYCVTLPVTGASYSASLAINAIIQPPAVTGLSLATAYADSEVTPLDGNIYYRTDGIFRCHANGVWVNCGSNGSSGVTSVSGTANQIDVATGTTTPVISLDLAIIFPGTLKGVGATGGAPIPGGINATQYLLNGLAQSSPAASLDCTQFSGADMSLQIAACITALNAISTTGGTADASGFSGAQTWSVNPFTSASSIAASGVLRVCNAGVIDMKVPVPVPEGWRIEGCTQPAGHVGTVSNHFKADATSYPATYTTGTVTFGTAGYAEAVTGSGTTWTSAQVGCLLVSPATQPTAANSTWGMIHSVNSATSITLGWGSNNGSGASAASGYAIECPMFSYGDGYKNSASGGPYMYDQWFSRITLDCNNVAGCIDLGDYYGNELSGWDNLAFDGFTNIGFDQEGGWTQNGGPFGPGIFAPGSSCTAATLPVALRGSFVSQRLFFGMSINGGLGGCGTTISEGVDLQASFTHMSDMHFESETTGIAIGLNTSCAVACPVPPLQVQSVTLDNIVAASTGTQVVYISQAIGTPKSFSFRDIDISGSWTNTVSDFQNGCGAGTNPLGVYELSDTGSIQNSSSSVAACKPAIKASSLIAANYVDGPSPITITTGSTATLGGQFSTGYTINNDGAAAVTYTLPTASTGKQYCVRNIAGATGTLELLTSASGQFIDNAGTYTATGGFVISGGALGDAACAVGIDSTHWQLWISSGTWATH